MLSLEGEAALGKQQATSNQQQGRRERRNVMLSPRAKQLSASNRQQATSNKAGGRDAMSC
jgi:hypothetical protein